MPTKEVLHGVDPREPFVSMGADEHSHFCPDHGQKYVCQEPAPHLPDGDSDTDCRWYDSVVCPDCMRLRAQRDMPLAAG